MENKKVTKYAIVYNNIIKNINKGLYEENKKLPPEKELAESFDVSVNTVRRALSNLISEGYILSRHGSGYYINDRGNSNVLTNRSLTQMNENVTSKVLVFKIIQANELEAAKLQIEENETIFYIKRLRMVNNTPFLLEHTMVPVKFIPSLTKDVFKHSFYKYLEEKKHLKIDHSIKEISSTILGEEEQKILNNFENRPFMVVENYGFLSNGEQFEYSYNIHTDKKFSIIINSNTK